MRTVAAKENADAILAENGLRALADPGKANTAARYFQTGKGQYGEGDLFYGIRVPKVREVARQFNTLPLAACVALLQSPYNEARLLALAILVRRFEKGDAAARESIYRTYFAQRHRVNNWNLVDTSAPTLLGAYLLQRDRAVLYALAKSPSMWDRRIAVLSTLAFIRANDFGDTLQLCALLLDDPEDLMHKACGWMLREVGKRDPEPLLGFIRKHYNAMPRTMLRYAIEKFDPDTRRALLRGEIERATSGG